MRRFAAGGIGALVGLLPAVAWANNFKGLADIYLFVVTVALPAFLTEVVLALLAGLWARKESPRRAWRLVFAQIGLVLNAVCLVAQVAGLYSIVGWLMRGSEGALLLGALALPALVSAIFCYRLLRRMRPAAKG